MIYEGFTGGGRVLKIYQYTEFDLCYLKGLFLYF